MVLRNDMQVHTPMVQTPLVSEIGSLPVKTLSGGQPCSTQSAVSRCMGMKSVTYRHCQTHCHRLEASAGHTLCPCCKTRGRSASLTYSLSCSTFLFFLL